MDIIPPIDALPNRWNELVLDCVADQSRHLDRSLVIGASSEAIDKRRDDDGYDSLVSQLFGSLLNKDVDLTMGLTRGQCVNIGLVCVCVDSLGSDIAMRIFGEYTCAAGVDVDKRRLRGLPFLGAIEECFG